MAATLAVLETACTMDAPLDSEASYAVTAVTYSVTLKTAVRGNFVSAANGGGGNVDASKTAASASETFQLADLDGGDLVSGDLVTLRTSNGHFLSAELGGGGVVDAIRTAASDWETFRVAVIGGTAGNSISHQTVVSLQTKTSGKFVSAAFGGGGQVSADQADASTWESFVLAIPSKRITYPQPGQHTGPGVLPPKAASATFLGPLHYDSNIARDLGFSGVVNGQVLWTFGDTLVQINGNFALSATDSVGLGAPGLPITVHDKNVNASGWPQEWIPLTAAESASGGLSRFAEGGTNVIEYAPGSGLVWFLKNDRGSGIDTIVGAGVATVTANENGATATRSNDTMWNSFEPYWGDIGVTYNSLDQNAYVFGHGPASAGLGANVYLARAPAARATDVSAYQYWDQSTKTWTKARFANGQLGTVKLTSAQAIFPDHALGQSNAFWSNYYNTWMFVHGADVGFTDIQVMTAPNLEGPWTKSFTIASTCPTQSCSGIRYAIAPHPELDPTGKSLLVTWTDSNVIYATTIIWQ